ncbi:MAG: dicarboxylate/amino acid:cation symporter [Gammaproteobacteria bacterium]|nr:dicarboxylate/amino acid:cation symporter [Gammaproteobacteria bacterium]
MPHRHALWLLGLIAVAVLAGGFSGWYFGPAMLQVAWLGELFLSALKMLIVPLIVAAVISSITGLGDIRRLGRVGWMTLAYYISTTAMAVLIGLLMVNLIQPGVGMETAGLVVPEGVAGKTDTGVADIVLSLVAPNIVQAAADTKLLPVIFFSIVFGLALTTLGERGRNLTLFFDGLNETMMKLVVWLMYLAPIGIFALVASRLGRAGGGVAFFVQIKAVGLHVVTVIAGLGVHFLLLFIVLGLFAGRGLPYLVSMARALITAFGTASSSATLPMTLECAEEAGVDSRAARFVIPLGSTINMDGTALYEAAAVMFIAQAYGLDMSLGQQAIIFLTATLAAVGAAGIPEAGLVTMVIVLEAVGLPLEGIGLLLAVDWFLDRFRTSVNVWGDAVGAALVDRRMRGRFGPPTT